MKIKLNNDKKKATEVKEALLSNDGYCPCKLQKIPSTKCICQQFLQGPLGFCQCGLYEKMEL